MMRSSHRPNERHVPVNDRNVGNGGRRQRPDHSWAYSSSPSFAVELAKRLGVGEEHTLKGIEAAALLHDMGKLAIPEHILNKPGKLTEAEFSKMKRHADIGADLLSSIRFPYPVLPIVRHHHEHRNGTGIHRHFRTDIPLGARIFPSSTVSTRSPRIAPIFPDTRLSDEDAFQILRDRRGTIAIFW